MSGSQNKMMSSMATPTRRRRGLASKLGPSGMSGFGDIGVAANTSSSIGPSGSFDNNNENPIPAQVSPLGGSERSSVGAAVGATSIASATNTSTVSASKVGVSLKPPRRVISLSPPLTRRGAVSNSKASTAPTAPPFNEDGNATATTTNSRSSTTDTFERKAPRREKSHDIDDEYFMGIPKNSNSNNRRRYFHARPVDPNVSGGAGMMNGSSSASQSNWFSSYYASKMMNHKLSLIIIQIIGLFLIVVMCLGVIVILQQGFSVVERGFPAGAGGGPSPSSPYHQAIDAMNNPPRSAQVTPELLEKLHQDNQLQHEELENLKKELRELHEKQEQQQKQKSGNGMKDVLQRSAGDAAGGPPVAVAAAAGGGGGDGRTRSRSPVDEAFNKMRQRSEQERQKKLRGAAAAAAASSLADQLPPAEKDVHLINRSPWEIQVFWISQNVIGYDPDDGTPMVEWLLMSGEEDRNILPSTTYHFHARPSHKFGIKRYPSNDSVIYVAPEFPQDQYIVLTEDFTIDTISDHTNSPFHTE
mmetsp:Transcript_61340/g.150143  ORF Transcript_61340/g.150143 Transcript_61340/m.150143 type:complete len:529 (+) Transcript_61340:370-1956(+)